MRLACCLILSLFFAASTFAQSRLTIDKLDRKEIKTAAKEGAHSQLLEGTVDDPDLLVFVQVFEPDMNKWRSYRATVERIKSEETGAYQWHAICHFGGYDGRGVGLSYQVRVVALDPKKPGQSKLTKSLSAGALQTNTLTIKRVK
jgi:hypothetical protein